MLLYMGKYKMKVFSSDNFTVTFRGFCLKTTRALLTFNFIKQNDEEQKAM